MKEKMNLIKTAHTHGNTPRFYKAVDIVPSDDSYHNNINLLDIEWWYFDAVFDNGYSIHIGFRTYHIKKSGIVQARITVYKDGEIICETLKPYLYPNFLTSKQHPLVSLDKKTVMQLDINHYKKTAEWKYTICLSIGKNACNLTFIGKTKGWKIETSETCWAVALPKAKVTGTITANGKKIDVKGIGYHDHNWSYSPITAVSNLGWFWGRITADTLNITWSKIIKDTERSDMLAVINQDKSDYITTSNYYNIHPSSISFKTLEYKRKNRKKIPTTFNLELSNNTSYSDPSVKADISMKTYNIHYSRIFTINYWRFHIIANGMIQVGSTTEYLKDKPQIIEYLLFKT
jgi:predicted secreted hydrolase